MANFQCIKTIRPFLYVLLLALTLDCRAESPNTIIAVHTVELNNKNKPINRTYAKKSNRVIVAKQDSDVTRAIEYGGLAGFVDLEPGVYCFKSVYINHSQFLGIVNPLCFRVENEGVTNAGTWVLGTRVAGKNWYAAIVDLKANHTELGELLEIPSGTPSVILKP